MCNQVHENEMAKSTLISENLIPQSADNGDESENRNESTEDVKVVAMAPELEKIEDFPQPAFNQTAMDDISNKLESLESLFKKRLSYDEGKEKILDKLHAELQDYKSDVYFKLTRPIFHDIAVVLDDIRKMKICGDLGSKSETESFMETVTESLLCLLDKYEVLPFSSEVNSKFDAVKQRIVGTKSTDNDLLVGLIAESVFAGLMQKDQLVFPEKVVIYKKITMEEN